MGFSLLLALATRTSAAAADAPQVAITSVRVPAGSDPGADLLGAEVVRGLEKAGWSVQDLEETRHRLQGRTDAACSAELCLLELSRVVGSPYFVHVVVSSSRRTYTVSMKMFGASEGRQISAEDVECGTGDICPSLPENVRNLAQSLGVKALKEIRPAPTAVVEPPHATSPTPPPPAIVATAPPAAGTATDGGQTRVAPIIAIAAGVVALGVGAYLVHLDGERTDCQQTAAGNRCFQEWNTESIGLVVGGLGLASALVGAGVIWRYGWSRNTTAKVAVGPGGISAWGTF
jgi:hypothetical protein